MSDTPTTLADDLADAVLSWQSGHALEVKAQRYRSARAASQERPQPDEDKAARLVWKAIETKLDPEAHTVRFDEDDWQSLLIEEEREEYREIARASQERPSIDVERLAIIARVQNRGTQHEPG